MKIKAYLSAFTLCLGLMSGHNSAAATVINPTPKVTPFNPAPSIASPRITLIIDDIGYNLHSGQRAIDLPGAINFAILPHTPYSKRLAKAAHEQGKTVMLHAPMSNLLNRQLGPGALSPEMSHEAFVSELKRSLAAIPFVQGLNNHMGSELTQDTEKMGWLMDVVAEQQLFFVDSRTTAASVAADVAQQNQIPHLSRDIFLDHIRTPEAVNASFDLLIKKAQKLGHVVGIGHPHDVTLDMLEKRLPQLEALGIQLISVPNQLLAEGQRYPATEGKVLMAEQLPLQPKQGQQAMELQPIVRSIEPAPNSQLLELQTIVREIVVSKTHPERRLYQPNRIKPLPERLEDNSTTEHQETLPAWVPDLKDATRQERPERLNKGSSPQAEASILVQPTQAPKWLDPAPVQQWTLPKNSASETP